jgi:hypothetical protein
MKARLIFLIEPAPPVEENLERSCPSVAVSDKID